MTDNITLFMPSAKSESTSDIEKLLIDNYRLTTAEIFYHLPDHPSVLQTFVWQEYDLAPKFPELRGFLKFWGDEIDGDLHSVYVASKELLETSGLFYTEGEFTI